MVPKCCLMVLVGFSLSFGQVLAETTEPPPLTVNLERNVYFQNANEEDVLVMAGVYEVSRVDEAIKLSGKNSDGQMEPILIKAIPTENDQGIEQPEVSTFPIGEDEIHVVLELPGGRGLGAIGTFSGIHSRAASAYKPEDAYITVYQNSGFKGKSKTLYFKDGVAGDFKQCLDNKTSSFILVAPRGVSITFMDKRPICYRNCSNRQATWWGNGVAKRVDSWELKKWGLHDEITAYEFRVDGYVPRCKFCRNIAGSTVNSPRC